MKAGAQYLIFLLLLHFLTGFPQNTPGYTVTVASTQSSGFYFLTPTKIGPGTQTGTPLQMIVDEYGDIVYYKMFNGAGSNDFKLHSNGMMSYGFNNKFYLMDSTFTIKDSVRIKNGIIPDSHDFQILPNGHFVLLGLENSPKDLSAYHYFNGNNSPGSANAVVRSGVIQEQDVGKNVVFEWHSKNNYNFSDVDPYFLSNPNVVDWTHFNAVEFDADGNYLVSVRHFNEITKIKRADSSIMWRLGGNANQFSFLNDAAQFKGQHDIRRITNGNVTINDNGRAIPIHPASAKEYQINETNLTANLVWSYTENNSSFSRAIGNHQRLANGNSLVNYGQSNNLNQIFDVVSTTGNKVFEIVFTDTLRSYRVFNYPTLPWDLKRPVINCVKNSSGVVLDAGSGYGSYLWNTGASTQTILVTSPGTFSVFVPKGQGGFISSKPFFLNSIDNTCFATSVGEYSMLDGFIMLSNPVDDIIYIYHLNSLANTEISLSNSFGVKCFSAELHQENEFQIKVAELPAGIYVLKVNGVVKKIFKN